MEEWKEYIVSDLGRIVTGKTPRTSIPENYGGKIPFLTPSDDLSGKYSPKTIKTITDTGLKEVKNCLLPSKSICVSCIGSDLGKVVITKEPTVTNQQFNSIIPNDKNDADYIYYLMTIVGKQLNYLSKTSTAVPIVNKSTFSSFRVKLPSKKVQHRISSILKSLDDKIEVNRKINENLEQQAQALFKSWFVDFEPFKNEEFVKSELGMIPKGWRVGTFGEIMTIASGKRPPKKESSFSHECNIPLVGASDIMGYTNSVLFNEDILVTGRVGTHGIVQRFNYPCWPSDNTLVLKSDYYEYCYQILCTIDYASLNRGSTQPLITQTDIKNQIILIPPYSVLSDFEKYASTLMKAKENNQGSSRRLAELRDTLLPKLMSGELKVNEIDKTYGL